MSIARTAFRIAVDTGYGIGVKLNLTKFSPEHPWAKETWFRKTYGGHWEKRRMPNSTLDKGHEDFWMPTVECGKTSEYKEMIDVLECEDHPG